jgi:hypothetical protein
VTGYVMTFAPFAVFGAISSVVAVRGLGILMTYGKLVGAFYLAMLVLWVIILSAGALFLRGRIFALIRYIREPLLLAFSTASSEAALPKLFEQLDRFGVPRRVSCFVLPLAPRRPSGLRPWPPRPHGNPLGFGRATLGSAHAPMDSDRSGRTRHRQPAAGAL